MAERQTVGMSVSPLGWACVTDPLEVLPFNDVAGHTTGENCACEPSIDDSGAVVHNAWDQREDYVERGRKPS